MYIKIKNKKIPIELKTTFKEKFKSFKFKLEKIETGICFIKKRRISTYLFCQPLDIIMTDKDNKILEIFESISSERFYKGPKNTYYTYILPNGVSNYYEIGDTFNVIDEKQKKDK